jgi:E3 ubiquitin-protein ligase SHPRH
MATPSPLTAVEWWRVRALAQIIYHFIIFLFYVLQICLDEAQMVECTSTKVMGAVFCGIYYVFTILYLQTAEMALRLSAVNRWCVTGTPIQRGIDGALKVPSFLEFQLFIFISCRSLWTDAVPGCRTGLGKALVDQTHV